MTEQYSHEKTFELAEKMTTPLIGHPLEVGLKVSSVVFLKILKNVLSHTTSDDVRNSLSSKIMDNILENVKKINEDLSDKT